MRYFFIVLMGWLPMLACAVAFDETTQRLPLGREMHVFEDVAGQSTMADVIAHRPTRIRSEGLDISRYGRGNATPELDGEAIPATIGG